MNKRELIRVLRTSQGPDSGCEKALELLDQYVEAQMEGRDAESLLPEVAEHLRNCAPCQEDRDALIAFLEDQDG